MSTAIEKTRFRKSRIGEPAWDIAQLFPAQGFWSEEEYLELDTNHLIEFDNGIIEVLPMPTGIHQAISKILLFLLEAWSHSGQRGTVFYAPIKLQLWERKYREPDLLFLLNENMDKYGNEFWTGADLVVEIISPRGRIRDTVKKRSEYAKAGIPEYWIVDPENERVTVLKLDGEKYSEHGVFKKGDKATSQVLKGFEADITKLFTPVVPKI